jgi:hypothetical protein
VTRYQVLPWRPSRNPSTLGAYDESADAC